jgi:hypothetical protein
MYNPLHDGWKPEVNLEIPIEDIRRNMEIDVSQFIEVRSHKTRSGHEVRLSYLPWYTAYELLRDYNPNLCTAVEHFANKPFLYIEGQGCLIYPFVMDKLSGKRTPALVYAVRDQSLSSPTQPSVDLICNNIQRAMVKAIAQFTGIGWAVYTSDESVEIIPPHQQQQQPPQLGKYAEPPQQSYQQPPFGRYSPHTEPIPQPTEQTQQQPQSKPWGTSKWRRPNEQE